MATRRCHIIRNPGIVRLLGKQGLSGPPNIGGEVSPGVRTYFGPGFPRCQLGSVQLLGVGPLRSVVPSVHFIGWGRLQSAVDICDNKYVT